MYFCDVMLALSSATDYQSSHCMPTFPQASYQTAYQQAFAAFLAPR